MNIKKISKSLQKDLSITEDYLALFIGVTPISLKNWEKEVSDKTARLLRLYEVVEYLKKSVPTLPQKHYKNFLDNARYVYDETNDEDGSTSLIGFILADPKMKAWKTIFKKEALKCVEALEDAK
jgi:DNA-binding XRE family transcriptional regulator